MVAAAILAPKMAASLTGSLCELALHTEPVAPVAPAASQRLAHRSASAASVGCGVGSNTRTVVVSGNFEGDTTRLDVVLAQSKPIARTAAAKHNRVGYAFLGNVVPDVHPARGRGELERDDALARIVHMAAGEGVALGDGHRVAPEDVLLLVGARELAWLRLANRSPASREIARYDEPGAAEALRRPTPFAEAVRAVRPAWDEHNQALKHLPEDLHGDALAVAMMLKLVSMAQLTMHAPGLVPAFLGRHEWDEVARGALQKFVSEHDGTIEAGKKRLLHGSEPTMEGLGVAPAAKQLVDAVLRYAEGDLHAYLSKAMLVCCVQNGPPSEEGEGGLWLTPSGTLGGEMVGRLPESVDPATLAVQWGRASTTSRMEWVEDLNAHWTSWYSRFAEGGAASRDVYEAFVAMSLEACGKWAHDALPTKGLAASRHDCCSGVTACTSVPFGTVQRRILVHATAEGDSLLDVMDAWTNINTDAFTPSTFWSVATWCGGTKRALGSAAPPPPLNLSEPLSGQLRDVSVTLASLLSTRVGDAPTVAEYGWEGINGMLGPVVMMPPHAGKQPMRVVSLTHASLDAAFVALLPETFVRYSCSHYAHHYEDSGAGAPALASQGFIALPDEAAIKLALPGRTEPENAALRERLGTRLWALPRKRSGSVISPFATEDYSAINAMLASEGPQRVTALPGFTLMHTLQTDADPLAGLNISLAPVEGYRSRMTIDTDVTNYHALFRVVSA